MQLRSGRHLLSPETPVYPSTVYPSTAHFLRLPCKLQIMIYRHVLVLIRERLLVTHPYGASTLRLLQRVTLQTLSGNRDWPDGRLLSLDSNPNGTIYAWDPVIALSGLLSLSGFSTTSSIDAFILMSHRLNAFCAASWVSFSQTHFFFDNLEAVRLSMSTIGRQACRWVGHITITWIGPNDDKHNELNEKVDDHHKRTSNRLRLSGQRGHK
ncbi:MAG: hypothetical protein M1816_006031 [Peltula sp. TS41687]|nr:MAG: hypothetical protein M1816_006031 [Peltula sp. TS41687]